MSRPFIYGKPVESPYFTDREKESGLLRAEIGNLVEETSINLAVLGPRRVGKTSLLKHVIRELEPEKKIVPLFIDCLSMPSVRRFSGVLAESAKTGYVEKTGDRAYLKKLHEHLKKSAVELLLKLSGLELSVASYLSIKISLEDPGTDEALIFETALNYLEELAKSRDVYFVVFLDEFAELAEKGGENFTTLLRTVIQQQKRVMYVFSSSAITYMNDLVYSSKSPFYRQLKPVFIGPLPEEHARRFIKERLALAGYSIEEQALNTMIEKSNSLPDYVQRLGDSLLDTAKSSMVTEQDILEAYEEIFVTLDPTFNLVFARLSENSKVYADILISSAKYSRPSRIAKDAGLLATSLPYYMSYLLNLGLVRKESPGRYGLVDPIFREWIVRKFMLEG